MKKEKNKEYDFKYDQSNIIVKESTNGYQIDLRKRLLDFVVNSA